MAVACAFSWVAAGSGCVVAAVDCDCRIWYLYTFIQLFCKLVSKCMIIQAAHIWFLKSYFCSSSPIVKGQAVLNCWHRWMWSPSTALRYLSIFSLKPSMMWVQWYRTLQWYIVLRFFVSFLPINVNELYELSFKKRGWTSLSPLQFEHCRLNYSNSHLSYIGTHVCLHVFL